MQSPAMFWLCRAQCGGRKAAEQAQGFIAGVPEFVFVSGRNGDGVPCPHLVRFVFDADFSGAVRDVINLLALGMKMFLRCAADGQARFGETLIADGGVTMREQFADFRCLLYTSPSPRDR